MNSKIKFASIDIPTRYGTIINNLQETEEPVKVTYASWGIIALALGSLVTIVFIYALNNKNKLTAIDKLNTDKNPTQPETQLPTSEATENPILQKFGEPNLNGLRMNA